MSIPLPPPSRRTLLTGLAAGLSLWGLRPRACLAARSDPRLLVVILRGGLDGLAAVAPVGDPDYSKLRGAIALPASGEGAGLTLDGFFALNTAMPKLHALYHRGEALFVHAVHTPYRERSHFDGQDVLESGLAGVARSNDGWLNRLLSELPSAGRASERGLSIGAVVPLIMRGPAPALSWIPKLDPLPLNEGTIARLMDLYANTDPFLAETFAQGLKIGRMAEHGVSLAPAAPSAPVAQAALHRAFSEPAAAAARFLAAADGPRIGVLSYNGWDTHAQEGVIRGQLANRLSALDAAIAALSDGLGQAWASTVAVLITEFGRTARVNGTNGTDHGMATVAVLIGGAVAGGRIIADWPGLKDAALYEGRDLKPTRDLRALLKGVLRDHVGAGATVLARTVFPDSAGVAPLNGLIRVAT